MTSDGPGAHDELLKRVGIQLGSMSTATDHLLLTRWRVLGLCQFLVGGGRGEAVELSVSALDLFIREEPSRRTDAAFRQAGNAIARAGAVLTGSVLPKITPEKQKEVRARLEAYEAQGASTVAQAIAALPSLRDRLQRSPMSALLAGIRHRLELVAALVGSRLLDERQRAAAAILYLDEFNVRSRTHLSISAYSTTTSLSGSSCRSPIGTRRTRDSTAERIFGTTSRSFRELTSGIALQRGSESTPMSHTPTPSTVPKRSSSSPRCLRFTPLCPCCSCSRA